MITISSKGIDGKEPLSISCIYKNGEVQFETVGPPIGGKPSKPSESAEINETVFTYSDGTTQTVDVVGILAGPKTKDENWNPVGSSYTVPQGATLTGVKIGRHVTTIGEWAFYGCISLTSIDIPSSVTTIVDGAFYGCSSLTSIKVVPGNPNYKDIDGILLSKDGKTLIQCPGGKSGVYTIPSGVTTIGNSAFRYCSSLTSVDIPSSVTTIEDYAFYNCRSLTSVTIPNSVTTIGNQVFSSCTSLKSVNIPSSVTTIGNEAFSYCSSLTSVDIPSSVTTIGVNAFSYCTSLTSVTIPNSVTTIEDVAFDTCTSLTSIDIPNSVTTIGRGAFGDCTSLTSVTIPNSVTTIGGMAFYNVKHIIYNGAATGAPWEAKSMN